MAITAATLTTIGIASSQVRMTKLGEHYYWFSRGEDLASGMLRRTCVPLPGELVIWNLPPSFSERSRIPIKP
jgi:hypothetical protein